jgi:FkbM family methyltransferase
MPEKDHDPFSLIRHYLPDWQPSVIFDVGANVGQSAKPYARRFPGAAIHSFEPSPATFRQLVDATRMLPQVVPHCLALGRGEARMQLAPGRRSTMNHLLPQGSAAPEGAVEVRVSAGATVMQELAVDRIDYLKIDTEGHDLEVLHGFLPVLDRIDFVEVEAGMNPYNRTHVPFAELDGFLKGGGFSLLHIFGQKMEWKRGGRPVLRRANPVYIARRLVDTSGIR